MKGALMFVDRIESPIGTIHLAVRGEALCALTVDRPLEGENRRTPISDGESGLRVVRVLEGLQRELETSRREYLARV